MNYFKLLNFEINRFIKLYSILILFTILSQITGVIVMAMSYMNKANEAIHEGGLSQLTYVNSMGPLDMFQYIYSLWFMGPIAISVAALIFYMFLIWYRDWFGKNTFIYRLLMLPTSRLNLFTAKATTIMLLVMGLTSLQLILLRVESLIFKSIVPKVFRVDLSISDIIGNFDYLGVIIPQSFTEFILYYGAGFLVVVTIFTAILFERSYRIKGIVLGLLYMACMGLLLSSPVITMISMNKAFLYPLEFLIVEVLLGCIGITISIWLSGYLLKNKVTV